ncbi:hypothetical protein B0T20DRAFT_62841 [Sordaria brevicollis]|uniref:Uncharacterized protein n=1 Tax=Sordaria brevicollis TaxID=83679 RepID=A0AAE0U5T8_SORBR|nr:hypothetical protein B0T20DRAFT_62841 [Sordaria brevicollis]
MTAISPTKRRILGSLNPNASPCLSSRFEFDGQEMEDVQATESSVLSPGCDKVQEEEESEEQPARKRVCLDHQRGTQHHQHQNQHQSIEAGHHDHKRNQPMGPVSPTIGSTTVLLNSSSSTKSTPNNLSQPIDRMTMMHEAVRKSSLSSSSVLPALHPNRVAAEGGGGGGTTPRTVSEAFSTSAPITAHQISYPAGLVEQNFNNKNNINHKKRPPKKTTQTQTQKNVRRPPRPPPSRVETAANQVARQKAEIIRLRLSLATYKIQTGQTDVPLEQLEVRSLLPPWASEYHHHSNSQQRRRRRERVAGWAAGVFTEQQTEQDYRRTDHSNNNQQTDNSNPASWSFSSSGSSAASNQGGHGHGQRVVNLNHLQHAAGAAIEAAQRQAKQEQQRRRLRTAWGGEEEREWGYGPQQYRHHHDQQQQRQAPNSWEDYAAEQQQQDHRDAFPSSQQSRQRRQQQHSNGRKKVLPDQSQTAPPSWGNISTTATTTKAAAATTTTTTTTIMSSPQLSNRLDLAERALQAHQLLQFQSLSREMMIPSTEHDHAEEERVDQELPHRHHYSSSHSHEEWVAIQPTTENDYDHEEEEGEEKEVVGGIEGDMDFAEGGGDGGRQSQQYIKDEHGEEEGGLNSGYSTEPEPELPSLPYAAADDEEEAENEEQNGDGDEAASGLLGLSRG